ncbi:MAG: DUF7557 family protein [Thermoplasmatota archaeon]
MASTSIPLDSKVRDRLKAYGTAGMSYNDILTRLMDEHDRDDFLREIRRELDETKEWVDLEDL